MYGHARYCKLVVDEDGETEHGFPALWKSKSDKSPITLWAQLPEALTRMLARCWYVQGAC